jgi:hypothetical protein
MLMQKPTYSGQNVIFHIIFYTLLQITPFRVKQKQEQFNIHTFYIKLQLFSTKNYPIVNSHDK